MKAFSTSARSWSSAPTFGEIGSEILRNLTIASASPARSPPFIRTPRRWTASNAYPSIKNARWTSISRSSVPAAAESCTRVNACIARGVRAICIISAGSSECGGGARARARAGGTHSTGGLPAGRLRTAWACSTPTRRAPNATSCRRSAGGPVAFSAQSGALGSPSSIRKQLHSASRASSRSATKPDVSIKQPAEYSETDPPPVGHPALPRELRQSQEVPRESPAALDEPSRSSRKAGRSSRGARRLSHTGALAAAATRSSTPFS